MSVTAVFITCGKNPDWFATLSAIEVPTYVVTHDFQHEGLNRLFHVKNVMTWVGKFHWGSLANLATRSTTSEWLLFLQDDVTPPSKEHIDLMIEQAEEAEAHMVFPSLVDDKICAQQLKLGEGWSDITEFSSNCAVLVRREKLFDVGGFPSLQAGLSFDLPHIQILFWKKGYRSIVSHDVRLKHSPGTTWSLTLTTEQRRRETSKAARWSFNNLGLDVDTHGRPYSPRLVHRSKGPVKVVRHKNHLIVGTKRISNPDPDPDRQLVEIVNISDYDSIEHDGQVYHRYSQGDRYAVVSDQQEFSFACHNALGLGDCFFFMKASAAIKKAFPNCRISISTDLAFYDLFLRCKDIDQVKKVSWAQTDRRTADIHRFRAFGMEEGPKRICEGLGIKYENQVPNYAIRDEDLRAAKERLIQSGWSGKPILGIQSTGGWVSKRWAYSKAFVRQALQKDYDVWIIGTDRSRSWRTNLPGVIDTGALPLPILVAALSLCEVVVGFDSGGVHAAAAVQTPIVSLWGPHDPVRMIFDASVYNIVAIRRRIPWNDCGEKNCRALSGGSICPLRNGSPGADCLDEIKPSEVWKYVDEVTSNSRG